jgi:hypothetical protein
MERELMILKVARYVLAVALTVSVVAPAGAGQRGQDGSLVGRISDSSDSPLPGVTVTASSPQQIGGRQTVITDDQGRYRFPLLSQGSYELEASLASFKTSLRSGIVLPPGYVVTVDFRLELASVAETVVVSGRPPVLDVKTTASTTLIERGLLNNLPLDRNVGGYVNLAPGVTRDAAFGGTVRANPVSLDGASGNEPGWGTPVTPLTRNWIEEIQVVGPGAEAQYGEYTGTLLNAITRSGTNSFAGLGEYFGTRPQWTGNNLGSLSDTLAAQFRPLEILERWETTLQGGGPFIQDRLWWFAGAHRYRNDTRTAAFSTVPRTAGEPFSSVTEQRSMLKVTAAPSVAMRLDGFFTHTATDGEGLNAGPLVRPEATTTQQRGDAMWNVRLTSTLASGSLLDVRHGGNRRHAIFGPPPERRSGPAPRFDSFTSVASVNTGFMTDTTSHSVSTSAALTHYVGGFAGISHEVKAGVEYERASLLDVQGYPGGQYFTDINGVPDQVRLWAGATYRGRQNRTTLYAQDAWHVAAPVTLNIGLRADLYHGNPPYDANYRAHSLAPRVGVAWDIGNAHSTVLRVHVGRFYDPMVTSYYDFLDPLANAPEITARVLGPNQFEELFRFSPATGFAIDPDIRASYVQEYLAAVERALPGAISLKAQYVYRSFEDTVSFIDTATVWVPIQVQDPGPDNRRGTADDAGLITVYNNTNPGAAFRVLTNPDTAYRRYHAAQLVASRRYGSGRAVQASYTWSRTRGNVNNTALTNAANNDTSLNGVFANPNRALYNDGRTSFDHTHALKVFGTLQLPWWGGWMVSGNYRYESGRPWGRTLGISSGLQQGFENVRVEPLARAGDARNTADVRIEKTISVRGRATVGLFADVFNVTNAGSSTGYVPNSGPRFGLPIAWIDPRTVSAGVRLMFR